MKIGVIYSTISGHSKKIAKAIAQKCSIPAYNIAENPPLNCFDLLFVVSGIYSGSSKPELLDFVKNLTPENVKLVTLITTSMNVTKSVQIRKALSLQKVQVSEEEFTCMGGFLFAGFSHPNKSEIAEIVAFSENIIKNSQS
ncbi:MAG: flavodoxin domain-containing protein [Oscillospiraceae bacterium]